MIEGWGCGIRRIVDCPRAEPQLTRTVLAERVGLLPDGVKCHIQNLKASGAIRRGGSDRQDLGRCSGEIGQAGGGAQPSSLCMFRALATRILAGCP